MTRLALLLLLSLPATAANTLRCVGSEFPYILSLRDGKPVGVAVDLLAELESRADFRCRIELLPWKRAQALVAEGQADLLIGPYWNLERDRQMRFVGLPFYVDQMVLYRRHDRSGLEWQGDYQRLAGRTIGVTRGWSFGNHFDQIRQRLQLDEADTLEQTLRKLVSGRVDLAASNRRNAEVLIEQFGWNGRLVLLEPPLQQVGGYFAFSSNWAGTPLFTRFEAAQRELVQNGRVQAISRRYPVDFPGPRFDWETYLRLERSELTGPGKAPSAEASQPR
ncbi:substrate-binding periplasmic protein [Chitinimonas lacunae]|uniref:Substrate-binding periplasmic protein n=1 Tax=Chitinimonas lacunae TaxID=1963018 RepID=A0ABV8MPY0_9NEIS